MKILHFEDYGDESTSSKHCNWGTLTTLTLGEKKIKFDWLNLAS